MNLFKTTIISSLLTLSLSLTYGQSANNEENSDEPKILKAITPINYVDARIPSLKLPKRKYHSPFFCNEIIQHKSGYIINSITSSRAGRQIDFTTNFYYYNLADKSVRRILISSADTVESILSSENTLYYSYIKNGNRKIELAKENKSQNLLTTAQSDVRTHIDTSKWVKLGIENDELFILTPNFLFQYTEKGWKKLVSYSLDEYYTNELKYRRSMSMLPTRNLVVKNGFVYFLQEVVQDRTCNLFILNTYTGVLDNYFTMLDYKDSYLKQVNDFTFLDDGSLLVSSSRLIGNNMLIHSKDNKHSVWAFNNAITTSEGRKVEVPVTTALNIGDTVVLASNRGLFIKSLEKIQPLLYFENSHQTIKEKRELIDFPFEPRSVVKLAHNNFLIGGMWGGLYQVDISTNRMLCLDDIDYDKIKTIDISAL